MRSLVLCSMLLAAMVAFAQQQAESAPPRPTLTDPNVPVRAPRPQPREIVVPAGTKIPVALRTGITTKNAHPGDAVYAQTAFPIAINDHIAIPAGTYVQGVISNVKRPGRVKGRAEILFHFTTLVFPSGYTVALPGAVDNLPGDENARTKDQEGTLQREGQKGKDVGTIATTAGTGAAIGAVTEGGAKGAAIGGGMGAAAGLAVAMLTRGSDLRLEQGSTVEMVLQRDLILDAGRVSH
jgi:type IV secretion system protein VirB10